MKSLRKCIAGIASVALALLPHQSGLACYGGGPYIRGHSTFVQDVAAPTYWPFFYSYELYNSWQIDPDRTLYREPYRRQDLVRDWTRYLGPQADAGDVYEFLYELTPDDCRALLAPELSPGENLALRDRVVGNDLITLARQPERAALRRYLALCKEVETVLGTAGADDESWEEPTENYYYDYQADSIAALTPPPGLAPIVTGLEKGLQTSTEPFLRTRYAYQLLVVSRYTRAWQRGIALYEKELTNGLAGQDLRYWAMHHAAYCYAQMGQMGRAALLQARVFAHSPAKRMAAAQYFPSKHAAEALKLAENDQDRADLLLIQAARTPAYVTELLRQLYAWTGAGEPLQLLVAREIVKLEEFFPDGNFLPTTAGTPPLRVRESWPNEPTTGRARDQRHLQFLLDFCLPIAQAPATPDKAAWELMVAHLLFLAERYPEAAIWLARAGHEPRATPLQREQARVTHLLLLVRPGAPLPPTTRRLLADELEWMRHRNVFGRFEDALAVVSQQLIANGESGLGNLMLFTDFPRRYFSGISYDDDSEYGGSGDDEASAYESYFGDKQSRYRIYAAGLDIPELEAMAHLLKTAAADPLVALVLRTNPPTRDLVFDELGSKYLLANRLEDAERAFAAVPAAYWQQEVFRLYLNEDPTQVTYFQNHGTHPLPPARRYDKLRYVREMLALRAAATKPSAEQGRQCLALANMYYNLSEDGNSWIMVQRTKGSNVFPDCVRNTDDFIADPPVKEAWLRNFYYLEDAHRWYLQAAEHAPTPEFGAAAYLMACRCDFRARQHRAKLWPHEDYDMSYYAKEAATRRRLRTEALRPLYQRYPQWADSLTSNCATYARFIAVR